ncbi:MAG: M23 family metallopeptidase [Alphaproteobacteria bacterium]|nr:M23 family metallopeptidase [Alphaproteobacteria bacterium]
MTFGSKNKILGSLRALRSGAFFASFAQTLSRVTCTIVRRLRLKERYVLSRHNHLRLRYVSLLLVFICTGFAALTLISPNSNAWGIGSVDIASIKPMTQYGDDVDGISESALFGDLSLVAVMPRKVPKPPPLEQRVKIEPGDALGLVLEKQGIGVSMAANVIEAMKEHYDPRYLKAGQVIDINYDPVKSGGRSFRDLSIALNPIKTLIVAKKGDEFKAHIDEKKVEKVTRAKQATVINSLYGSAVQQGIPQSIIAEAIRIYSWNVDFQRDIRSDDFIEIMYESYETKQGHVAKNGDILYAKLTLSGREIALHRFEMKDGRVGYFQPDGRSIKRTLMRTPINGARMSSGYGMRKHPVLGYSKMHKGVDFAAPTGTPIFAAGDGVVEKAGWFSSYGRYIRIRHNSKLKTAYAHMSKIKSNIKPGVRVTQGEVIAYVGSTGRSTGPHLHYEVMSGGKQVNPNSIDLPIGEELEGAQLVKFKDQMTRTKRQFASALDKTRIAERKQKRKSFF